jgi:hypothetical protein
MVEGIENDYDREREKERERAIQRRDRAQIM